MSRRRVVITGLGLISPVGNSVEQGWANIVAGRSGIAAVTKFDASNLACRFAGEVKGFNVEEYFPAKEAKHKPEHRRGRDRKEIARKKFYARGRGD